VNTALETNRRTEEGGSTFSAADPQNTGLCGSQLHDPVPTTAPDRVERRRADRDRSKPCSSSCSARRRGGGSCRCSDGCDRSPT
jgi:hypothetical protein